ncbi:hypothetical protein LOK49_LG13G00410 [Camellia lanceoleosa]|uniref:Uncharacterized protein n=1 Tax=Camellia lanceoleosa TaxID=1840588 RepID=A0ACC0FIQ6_9ERIC|nr:hypothetical protein LOK49_LG13G00410 [Camellia lanceoleosa]
MEVLNSAMGTICERGVLSAERPSREVVENVAGMEVRKDKLDNLQNPARGEVISGTEYLGGKCSSSSSGLDMKGIRPVRDDGHFLSLKRKDQAEEDLNCRTPKLLKEVEFTPIPIKALSVPLPLSQVKAESVVSHDNRLGSDFVIPSSLELGWYIWKDRNNFVFNHIPIEPSSTLHRARVAKADFDGANFPSTAVQTQNLVREDHRRSQWLSPSPGHYKINFDVATKKGTAKATVAAILQDSGGRILDGLVKQWSISSSFQGEALACQCACQLA